MDGTVVLESANKRASFSISSQFIADEIGRTACAIDEMRSKFLRVLNVTSRGFSLYVC